MVTLAVPETRQEHRIILLNLLQADRKIILELPAGIPLDQASEVACTNVKFHISIL
jgi:hypothetical protein